jgi:ApaG protein
MTNPCTSTAVTEGIQVDVSARFVAEQSSPERNHWFFAYQITISNLGERTVQLISREWVITNCPLDTAVGTMEGKYHMVAEDGTAFEVAIAPFTLADPMSLN